MSLVSVPLRGNGFETYQPQYVGGGVVGLMFPSPCGVMGLKHSACNCQKRN